MGSSDYVDCSKLDTRKMECHGVLYYIYLDASFGKKHMYEVRI